MASKGQNQVTHAKRRFSERFGIKLGQAEIEDILKQVRSGKSKFIKAESNRVTRHRVIVWEQEVDILYDKSRGTVVTALNKEMG